MVTPQVGIYNLRQILRQSDSWKDGIDGNRYYETLRDKIRQFADDHGLTDTSIETLCGLFAVMSPNNTEKNDLIDTVDGVRLYQANLWDTFRPRTYGNNKIKAHRILSGERPSVVIQGQKTRSFYFNLISPDNLTYVTIDGHMYNAYNNVCQPLDNANVSTRAYRQIRESVIEIANQVGLIPSGIQASIWLTWRRINRILYDPQVKFDFARVGVVD